MTLSIIVAMADDRVIGRDNALPWRLPADLRRFKRLTLGHHLLVGRRTWESIGRPLPGRRILVITRQADYAAPADVRVAHSLGEAIRVARAADDDEAFVGGGAEIYREALDRADRLYLTRIHARIDGDTRFPAFDESRWRLLARDDRDADARNPWAHSYLVYERRREPDGRSA